MYLHRLRFIVPKAHIEAIRTILCRALTNPTIEDSSDENIYRTEDGALTSTVKGGFVEAVFESKTDQVPQDLLALGGKIRIEHSFYQQTEKPVLYEQVWMPGVPSVRARVHYLGDWCRSHVYKS